MKILFVEDDAMNRRVVRDMLSVAGIEMTEAASAEAGLALIDRTTFDIVLMDLRMPGMDGLTAIDHIRARPDSKAAVPIIVITADAAARLREDCIARGADELLTKPIAMQQLFDSIGRVLTTTGTLML
jgi:CheY-like chemotaxis protein